MNFEAVYSIVKFYLSIEIVSLLNYTMTHIARMHFDIWSDQIFFFIFKDQQ